MVVSLSNLNSMLICANNNQTSAIHTASAKKVFEDPFVNYGRKPSPPTGKSLPMVNQDRKSSPFKESGIQKNAKIWKGKEIVDGPIKIDGRKYPNIDAFLRTIVTHPDVNTEKLAPEMKKELVKLYILSSKEDIRFKIFCGFRTKEQNEANLEKARRAGRPNAVGKNSPHMSGLAVDLKTQVLTVSQKMRLIELWKGLGHPSGLDVADEMWHFPYKINYKSRKPTEQNKKKVDLHS